MKMRKTGFFLLFIVISLTVLGPVYAQTKVATDPTRIGVGARPLGMGKSFIGLADDTSSIFVNPAGLSGITQWQATSMSGKFINEFDYLNLGVAYPTRLGVLGLGYVGGSISFRSPVVTTEVVDGVRIIPTTGEGETYSFGNSVLLLSWGKELKGLFNLDLFNHLSAGATLKFFSLNLSGPGIDGGTASGNELDLGIHYKPNPIFKAGAVLQNGLPFNAGGKIKWGNGTEESLLSTLKFGLSFRLLGEEGWQTVDEHELSLNCDYDSFPNRSVPGLWHLGAEWSPLKLIDIRLGIDQETIGTGTGGLDVANNFTAGVGLYLGGFRFDYAYHQYNNLSANDTNYFSLSYGVRPVEEGDYIVITSPVYGAIEYPEYVKLMGSALRRDVGYLVIQNSRVELERDRTFSAYVSLEYGRNFIPIQVFSKGGRMVDEINWKIIRLVSFKDVTAGYWAKLPIEYLATLGIITGYPDKTFRPEGTITRAEITTLLVRTQGAGDETGLALFTDVPSRHWAARYIAVGVKNRLVVGYPDETFRPNRAIIRAEGLALITRFAKLPNPRELVTPFRDVPARYWAYSIITSAKEAGYLDYITENYFRPRANLKRGEVAYLLYKTDHVKKQIREKLL
jgi:hypothetical protein